MSALDFLSVSGVVGSGSFAPVARSSMDRRQRDAGAAFEAREGWLVPVSLPGEEEWLQSVGVADLSHLSIFEVRPSDPMVKGDDIVWHRISDRRSLVLCPSTHAASVLVDLGERFVLDLSGALSVIALVGPEAQTVLRRLTHLHHLPASGEVAHISAHVLKVGQMIWIVFAQEFGHYLWDVVVDRAAALGGGPVGVDALLGSVAS